MRVKSRKRRERERWRTRGYEAAAAAPVASVREMPVVKARQRRW